MSLQDMCRMTAKRPVTDAARSRCPVALLPLFSLGRAVQPPAVQRHGSGRFKLDVEQKESRTCRDQHSAAISAPVGRKLLARLLHPEPDITAR